MVVPSNEFLAQWFNKEIVLLLLVDRLLFASDTPRNPPDSP